MIKFQSHLRSRSKDELKESRIRKISKEVRSNNSDFNLNNTIMLLEGFDRVEEPLVKR